MSMLERSLVYSKEQVTRTPPINIKSEDIRLFEHEYNIELQESYSYIYINTCITGRGIATHKSKLLSKIIPQYTSTSRISNRLKIKSLLQKTLYRKIKTVSQAILITDIHSHGYFHWMTDVLPKIFSLQKIFTNQHILIPEKFNSSFAQATLDLLHIDSNQILVIPNKKKIIAKKLYTMDHLAPPFGTGNYRAKIMQQIRASFFDAIHTQDTHTQDSLLKKYGTRIYISRAHAKYRQLINEKEIKPLLCQYKFSILYAENLSFKEQLLLFSKTEILMSIHGAGLTNMLWMPESSSIVEIRHHEDRHNNCYFSLASSLNLKYYYSLAESKDKETHTAQLFLDYNKVRTLLEEIYE